MMLVALTPHICFRRAIIVSICLLLLQRLTVTTGRGFLLPLEKTKFNIKIWIILYDVITLIFIINFICHYVISLIHIITLSGFSSFVSLTVPR